MDGTTFENILKAIGEVIIAFFKSDIPETIIAYCDVVVEGLVEVVRHAIDLFIN